MTLLTSVVKNRSDLFPPVLTFSGEDEFKFGRSAVVRYPPPVLTSSGEDEFKFGRSAGRHLADLQLPILTSSGEDEFKFGRSAGRSIPAGTDI